MPSKKFKPISAKDLVFGIDILVPQKSFTIAKKDFGAFGACEECTAYGTYEVFAANPTPLYFYLCRKHLITFLDKYLIEQKEGPLWEKKQ